MQTETKIHPTAVVEPGAKLGAGVYRRAVLPCRRGCRDRRPRRARQPCHRCIGRHDDRRGLQGLSHGRARRAAAEHQAQGRAARRWSSAATAPSAKASPCIAAPTPAAARRRSATTAISSPIRTSRMTASSATTSPWPIVATLGGHCRDRRLRHASAGWQRVHQFVRIGHNAFLGGGSLLVGDVIPYGMAMGNRASCAASTSSA